MSLKKLILIIAIPAIFLFSCDTVPQFGVSLYNKLESSQQIYLLTFEGAIEKDYGVSGQPFAAGSVLSITGETEGILTFRFIYNSTTYQAQTGTLLIGKSYRIEFHDVAGLTVFCYPSSGGSINCNPTAI